MQEKTTVSAKKPTKKLRRSASKSHKPPSEILRPEEIIKKNKANKKNSFVNINLEENNEEVEYVSMPKISMNFDFGKELNKETIELDKIQEVESVSKNNENESLKLPLYSEVLPKSNVDPSSRRTNQQKSKVVKYLLQLMF